MTKPSYLDASCSARSQVHGKAFSPDASAPRDYAWVVNFNNGNVNLNNQNNRFRVRAVRSCVPAGECQDAQAQVSLRALYVAWKNARRHKRPSVNQCRFDVLWGDGLLGLQRQINGGAWRPQPSTCFIAAQPKAREIHAPAFADRVVHHWLVPQLEAIYEPAFIHDSYANRKGKGSHAAVRRLQAFVRQVQHGQGGGYYLQLDIHNFFNSIHRPTLYAALKRRMERNQLPLIARRVTHALLRQSASATGVLYRATAAERAAVPLHKRLENAAPGCGLPIGNLSSQFFANVYLDALDQFVKHTLKAKRYLRYVDDFILVHESREQLAIWQAEIEVFLRDRLRLSLKADTKLQPLCTGIDFLGYVVYPTHARVRRRVVTHARLAIADWGRAHVSTRRIRATPAAFRQLEAIWASYQGHFAHAASWRLQAGFHHRFPWLHSLTSVRRRFDHRLEDRPLTIKGAR